MYAGNQLIIQNRFKGVDVKNYNSSIGWKFTKSTAKIDTTTYASGLSFAALDAEIEIQRTYNPERSIFVLPAGVIGIVAVLLVFHPYKASDKITWFLLLLLTISIFVSWASSKMKTHDQFTLWENYFSMLYYSVFACNIANILIAFLEHFAEMKVKENLPKVSPGQQNKRISNVFNQHYREENKDVKKIWYMRVFISLGALVMVIVMFVFLAQVSSVPVALAEYKNSCVADYDTTLKSIWGDCGA